MKPIFLHEFERIVGEASTIITAHTDHCPSVVVSREATLEMARAAVRTGSALKVEVWHLTTEPQILLGSATGRRVVA